MRICGVYGERVGDMKEKDMLSRPHLRGVKGDNKKRCVISFHIFLALINEHVRHFLNILYYYYSKHSSESYDMRLNLIFSERT